MRIDIWKPASDPSLQHHLGCGPRLPERLLMSLSGMRHEKHFSKYNKALLKICSGRL